MKLKINENTKVTISLGLLVAMLIFLVTATVAATGWKTATESRIIALEGHNRQTRDDIDDMCAEMDVIRTRQYEQDAIFAEIRTDLKWIRAVMEDK